MDKALEFLEEYCQWLAVALGGLFLAWMLWAYVLMTPISVAGGPGGAELTPGNVDDLVKTSVAERLQTDIDTPGTETPPASASVEPKEPFVRELAGGDFKPPLLASTWANSPPSEVNVLQENTGGARNAVLVEAMPELPPVQIVEALAKRAYVGPPLPPAGAVPPPEAAVPQPPVAGAAAGPVIPPGHDQSYVRLSYNLDTPAIAKAFEAVKIVQGVSNTGVVAVKLMRQEKLPNGTWGDPVEVPYLKNNVQTWPPPPNGAGLLQVNNFRGWADSPQGMNDLLRPAFYPVIYGEGPWDPSEDSQLPVFDPAAELKKKQEEARIKAEARRAARPQTPPRAPRSTGRRGGGGGDEMPAVSDPQRPDSVGGVIFPQQVPPGEMQPGETPMDVPATPTIVAPGAGLPPTQTLPQPNFKPAETPAILCWAYDETVVEGHTYRYQVLYALRSPVFNSNITKPAELAQIFAVWSKLRNDAWSTEVMVRPTAEFYLTGNNWRPEAPPAGIKIDVFKWAMGKWHLKSFNVAPGDTIGTVDGGVDYNTNVAVVDLRYDRSAYASRGRAYVVMLTADGRLEEREPTADVKNARMQQLRFTVEQQKAANAQAAGAAGAPAVP